MMGWAELSSLGSLQMFVVIIRKCANINLVDVKSWLGRKPVLFPQLTAIDNPFSLKRELQGVQVSDDPLNQRTNGWMHLQRL